MIAARRLAAAQRRRRPTYVYAIAAAGKVKIGIARDPAQRLADLQTGSPVKLKLVRVIETDRAVQLESRLHRRWAAHRAHGEWFDARPVIADLAGLTDGDLAV